MCTPHATPCYLDLAGVSKPVDIASANGKYFVNMATGGFGTEAAKQTDSGLKDKVGGAAYVITGEAIKVLLLPLSAKTVLMSWRPYLPCSIAPVHLVLIKVLQRSLSA